MRFRHVAKLRFVERPPRQEGWRALHRAADRGVPLAEEAFRASIATLRRAVRSAEIVAALERDAPEIAISAFPWARLERALEDKLLPVLADVAAGGGRAAVSDLGAQLGTRLTVRKAGPSEISTAFNLVNPEVLKELAAHGADLVTNVTRETRIAIQQIVLAAQQQGLDVPTQARRIAAVLRQSVGLNAAQARALINYEIALTEAERAPTDIASLLAQRRERFIDQRARVIARQETMHAANVGQQDVWRQAKAMDLLPANQQRKWLTQGKVNPNNPCAICAPMNGQIRGLEEDFTSPLGWSGRTPPAHVGCLCVTVLHFPD